MVKVNAAHYYAQLFVPRWGKINANGPAGGIVTLSSYARFNLGHQHIGSDKRRAATLYDSYPGAAFPLVLIYRLSSLSSMQYIR